VHKLLGRGFHSRQPPDLPLGAFARQDPFYSHYWGLSRHSLAPQKPQGFSKNQSCRMETLGMEGLPKKATRLGKTGPARKKIPIKKLWGKASEHYKTPRPQTCKTDGQAPPDPLVRRKKRGPRAGTAGIFLRGGNRWGGRCDWPTSPRLIGSLITDTGAANLGRHRFQSAKRAILRMGKRVFHSAS